MKSYLRLVWVYIRLNCKIQLEYRTATLMQFSAMFINNSTWLAFWLIYFERFPHLSGCGKNDVVTLWAIASAGFGISSAFLQNLQELAPLITRGGLDAWLLYPRRLLPHLALGKMSATALGDLAFGYLSYCVFVRPDLAHLLLFTALTFSAGLVFVGFNIMRGSLAFVLPNADTISEQWFISMITFSTYPSALFDGWVKLLLYSLIPAGFVAGLPVSALADFDLEKAALALAGAGMVFASGCLCFTLGLSRYQSGNQLEMRS